MKFGSIFALLVVVCTFAVMINAEEVVTLTDANFDELTSDGPWLVKFYAPWCGHCKRLAPIFDSAAEKLNGKVRLGKVDCTVETELASRFGIRGYPTVNFIRGKQTKQYSGGRSVEAIVQYCESMSGPASKSIDAGSLSSFNQGPKNKFVYIGDDAEDERVFIGVAETFQGGNLEFAHTKDASVAKELGVAEGTNLVAITDEGNQAMEGSLNTESINKFVKTYQFPLISEIGAENFRDLTGQGVLTIMAVVNPDDASKTPKFLELARSLARANRGGRFVFAWINGVQWIDYVSRFDIALETYPRMMALDAPANRFFADDEVSEQTFEAYSKWLDVVEAKNEDAKTWLGSIKDMASKTIRLVQKNMIASAAFLAMAFLGIYVCFSVFDEEPVIQKKPKTPAKSNKAKNPGEASKDQEGEEEDEGDDEGDNDDDEGDDKKDLKGKGKKGKKEGKKEK